MPKALPWILVGTFEGQVALDATLSAYLHTIKLVKSQSAPCTLCLGKNTHHMRFIRKKCGSSRCNKEAISGNEQQCSFELKIMQCLVTHISQLYEIGSHVYVAEERSPKKPKIGGELRSYIEERIVSGKLPTQIHADITSNRSNLGLLVGQIPTLQQIQGFMKRYRSHDINENDRVDTLINLLEGKYFDNTMEDIKPFYFGVELNEKGEPLLGDGSDKEPFFLALSTKRLLKNVQIAADAGPVLLHADATFKLTQTSYPLLALGVSDRSGTFHLVCLVLTSNRNTITWAKALREIKILYANVIGSEMNVDFVMGDADDAQHAAFMEVFSENTYLMCYFHVVKNIREKCRGLSSYDYISIMEDVNLLHYARDSSSFTSLKDDVLHRWGSHVNVTVSKLRDYVDDIWLNSSFHRWQAFWTPYGFMATNNPVEQFNNTLKQTWTCRKKLKVPVLVEKLLQLLEYHSIHAKTFQQNCVPPADILKRMTSLRHIGLLREKAWEPNVTSTVYQGEEQDINTPEIPLESEKYATKLVNSTISYFARWVEVKDMPARGWIVSLNEKICPCLYFKKFGYCVHLLFAFSEHRLAIPGLSAPPRTFVNRTVHRGRGRSRGRGRGGRPRRAGAALEMT